MNQQSLSAFIWSVADLLRGDYKQSEYGRVILPFTVLRRLDCVLAPTKAAVLAEKTKREAAGLNPEPFLLRIAGQSFYNTSPLDMKTLMGDQDHIRENLYSYLQAFAPAVRDVFERFEFHAQVERLARSGLLYRVVEKFANIDLHPERVSNHQMGLVFEELIRKFAEISNETAGEHFTPREVIRLMVNLIFVEDDDVLSRPGVVRTLYDPTAGTGGMLSIAGEYLAEHNPEARLTVFGQELNPESYAICKADMVIKGQDVANIAFGNTLSDDGHSGKAFDYMLSNPPFGVEWKKVEKEVRKEHEQQGYNGRFGPGLPRVSDGSMLFLLHLIAKMRPTKDGGSRFGIVLNGSPLFTGGAGSGESEIRRYVLENDLCEAIVGLPTDMFYNTGISTYVWIVSNRKPEARKGKVQLIDASGFWQKMRKSLGSKRKELSDAHIADITRLFGEFVEAQQATVFSAESKELARQLIRDGEAAPEAPDGGRVELAPISRIFPNEAFGYRTITVERPQRDEAGNIVLGQK
ncbi:MAG: class I SAM-dependent DNA methyltransferase, partial [Polycyclovorans sp.]